MNQRRIFLAKMSAIFFLASTLSGCLSTQHTTASKRDNSPYISQFQAQERAKVVSDVAYQLQLNLSEERVFSGKANIQFNVNGTAKNLTLDLNQANIKSFVINGQKLYPNYNGYYITINASLLVNGLNSIDIEYSREHSTNGEGLHRFEDPVDGKVYLYSHFEPAAAQQMFPVFDQPDLKATYTLTVNAPQNWHVISAMPEQYVNEQGDKRVWQFPITPKLSPYNFSLHAGPYHVWQDNSGRYPMRLFARQSVKDQVKSEHWFTYTKQGLNFFEQYFGIDYPFAKYDQLLVPDFLYGAMENAGAITFSEDRFLYKAEMTAAQKERLAGVIMHEMAHQWFGNLVTMKWWNGLWLNESFASFMGTLATAEATEFTHAWRSFYSNNKQKAYHLDSLVTSHPIEVPVATTQNAFDNIDAITYHKGASVLKQLRHLIGEETFRRGVSQYLTQYSYQNAELTDFIDSLAKASNRDLSDWTQEWLYKAGVNQIQAEFVCGNGTISEFTLTQKSVNDDFATLREQKVKIGLLYHRNYGLDTHHDVTVTYQGETTSVDELVGQACPDIVYPNIDDWGYVKVALDKRSMTTVKQSLNRVNDPLLRSMLWQSVWDSVVDGGAPLNDFINVALINAPLEKDYTILGQVINHLYQAKDMLDLMSPSHQRYNERISRALSQMSLRMTMEHHKQSDFQRRWFSAYIHFSNQAQSLSHLEQLLSGKASIRGLDINQDLRWDIIKQLNRFDYGSALALLNNEKARDSSDAGEKAAIAAEVIRPQAALKRQWLNRIEYNQTLSFAKKRVAMESLYPPEQQLLNIATAEQRLANLTALEDNGPVFMRSYASTLIPTACSIDNIALIDDALNTQTSLSKGTRRALLEARQAEQRCIAIKHAIQ